MRARTPLQWPALDSRPPTFTGLPSLLKFPYKLDIPQLGKMYSDLLPIFKLESDMNQYEVTANGAVFGCYGANAEEEARNLCAQDAGYESEADMELQIGQESQLEARQIQGNE